jgi:hypothetical protein
MHGAFEDVSILAQVGYRWLRARYFKKIAELAQE